MNTILIAHRGSSYEAPENTLGAVNLAWEQNADAVEVDVHLSLDNKVVVIHDSDTYRTTGEKKVINASNYDDISSLDAGSWKGEKWRAEKIPLLDEVIETVPKNKKLFVEIKGGFRCMEHAVKLLKESKLNASQIIIMDFHLEVVKGAKQLFNEAKILWLYEFPFLNSASKNAEAIQNLLKIAADEKFDGVNIENSSILTKSFILEANRNNLEVYCWTVDNLERAKELIANGINGVTTNRTGLMKTSLV